MPNSLITLEGVAPSLLSFPNFTPLTLIYPSYPFFSSFPSTEVTADVEVTVAVEVAAVAVDAALETRRSGSL